jgi:phosphoserine phosphatase
VPSREPRGVAFFRVEGALASSRPTDAAAWLALRSRFLAQKVFGWTVARGAGVLGLASSAASETQARLGWMMTRRMSADRLRVMGELYAEKLAREIEAGPGPRLMKSARDRGDRIVWISELLDWTIEPLAARFGVSDVLCNRLEMRNERATGRLQDPVALRWLGGADLRDWCAARSLGLDRAAAYGSQAADQTLLSAVKSPCAVRPDFTLRRVAAALGWPIVDR